MSDSLVDTLRQPRLSRLLDRLAQRLRSHGVLQNSITLRDVTPTERSALEALTAQPSRGRHFTVDVAELESFLLSSGRCLSLAELVEAAVGESLRDIARRKQCDSAAWNDVIDGAARSVKDRQKLSEWLQQKGQSGHLKKLATDPEAAARLVSDVLRVTAELPKPIGDAVPLSVFAADTCGDAHALDSGTSLGRLVIGAAAALAGDEPPRSAGERRRVWESVGIVPDEMSATVLVWNLRADDASLVGQTLNRHADAGEPLRLTFAQLRRHPAREFRVPAGRSVFVCENPAVVAAAAAELKTAGGPLICVDGQPNLAVLRLLTLLADNGQQLVYHGDFDWGGLRIANFLMRQLPIEPWRYRADDYVPSPGGRKLKGSPVAADWDTELGHRMQAAGTAVDEESVIAGLLADLRWLT
ncbi:MAG: TIGR02679 family protein [Planctomycetales bacterium]|nr:TIGR02679 family protein [Planctomycetales bacterium]